MLPANKTQSKWANILNKKKGNQDNSNDQLSLDQNQQLQHMFDANDESPRNYIFKADIDTVPQKLRRA